jgi:hypothetical protein
VCSSTRAVGALVLGQDLQAGYIGQDGVNYQLYLT